MWCGYNQIETFSLPEGRTRIYLDVRFQEYSPQVEEKFIQDAEEHFQMPLSDTIYTYERIKGGYTSTYQMVGAISSLVSVILAGMIIGITIFLIQSDMSEDIRKMGIYKCIGMTSWQIIISYIVGYGIIGLAGTVAGSILGRFFNEKIVTSILGDLGIFTIEISGTLGYQLGVCLFSLSAIILTSFVVILKIHKLNASHAIRRGTWSVFGANKQKQKEKKELSNTYGFSFEFYYAIKGIGSKKARFLFVGAISLILGALTTLAVGSLEAVKNIDEEPEIWGFMRSDIYVTALEDDPVSSILGELAESQKVDYTYGVHRIYPQYKTQEQGRYQSIMASLHELPWNSKMNYKCLEGRAPEREYEIGIGDYMLVLNNSSEKWDFEKELNQKYEGRFTFIASKSNGENLVGALAPVLITLIAILLLFTVLITMNLTLILIKREQNLIGMLKAVGMPCFLNSYAKVLGLAEYPFSTSLVGNLVIFLLLPTCMLIGTSTIIKGIGHMSVKRLVENL